MNKSVEFEVWQYDEMVACVSGPEQEAMTEICRYAGQYMQDGPIQIFKVERSEVPMQALLVPSIKEVKSESL